MGTISSPKKRFGAFFGSSQLRYAAAYVLITSAVLIFLNIYTPIPIRSLTFSSQRTAMNDKAQLIVSAFSSYEELNADSVRDVIQSVSELHTNRVIIADPSGCCLYDSLLLSGAEGKLVLLPELAEALAGNDVFHIRYEEDRQILISKAAMPIMAYNRLIGAVYLMELSEDQGALIARLQNTIFRITLGLEIAVILFSMVFALLYSLRVRKILHSIRQMRDGDYTTKLDVRGKDEVSRLGSAFNELAVRLNQSESVRKQFVSDASHELKTPLASIKLLSDSILHNDMDQEMLREFVSDIGNEADRLTRLSEKLLELTRLDSHVQDTQVLVSVRTVCDRVLRMLLPLARRNQVRLDLNCPEDCSILSTEDDLYQIIFNLAENAIKYNRPEGRVLIRAERLDNNVTIAVEDTGSGIPDEAKEHIFERFYRVDKARSRKAGGAGLGLSIVHDMVERNHGSIAVADRLGGGSVFTLTFPLPETKEVP